jgi:hypothetical protein
VVAEGVGIAAGIAVVLGATGIDLLAVIAALAAAGTAWVQVKQYGSLATAYSIAAQELASISAEVDTVSEGLWAVFVANAEEAISREHTLWRASRGLGVAVSR